MVRSLNNTGYIHRYETIHSIFIVDIKNHPPIISVNWVKLIGGKSRKNNVTYRMFFWILIRVY